MTPEPRKSLADKVIDLIAGDSETSPKTASAKENHEEKNTIDEKEPARESKSELASAETSSQSEATSTPKKRKPAAIATDNLEKNETTGKEHLTKGKEHLVEGKEPLTEGKEHLAEGKDMADDNVNGKKTSMAEAKEKVQHQVNDVLERQKAGETAPSRPNSTQRTTQEATEGANGSRTSIPESPLKKHVIETEDMARAEISKNEPNTTSTGGKGTSAAAGAGIAGVGAAGMTAATLNRNNSRESISKKQNSSNPSLRDSSLAHGGVSVPVAIHSGTMYKQGKYLTCTWKQRHFQLFSSGELKWYLPGNSATVKGTLSDVNSSCDIKRLPDKKVTVTRADKSKVPLQMMEVKVANEASKKTMLIGMESEQELTTFVEKTKQISSTSSGRNN